jgi:hypothetical protein
MGQIRDAEQMVSDESLQAVMTENTTLRRRVLPPTQEHRALQERLDGARSNNRFADKRIADLEVQLLEQQAGTRALAVRNRGASGGADR